MDKNTTHAQRAAGHSEAASERAYNSSIAGALSHIEKIVIDELWHGFRHPRVAEKARCEMEHLKRSKLTIIQDERSGWVVTHVGTINNKNLATFQTRQEAAVAALDFAVWYRECSHRRDGGSEPDITQLVML